MRSQLVTEILATRNVMLVSLLLGHFLLLKPLIVRGVLNLLALLSKPLCPLRLLSRSWRYLFELIDRFCGQALSDSARARP